jgi:hypothetical protein
MRWRRREQRSERGWVAPARASERRWAWLPPIQRSIPDHPVVNPPDRFSAGLAAWRNPSLLAGLGHLTGPAEPAGVLPDLLRPMPVQRPGYRLDWELPVAQAASTRPADPPPSHLVDPSPSDLVDQGAILRQEMSGLSRAHDRPLVHQVGSPRHHVSVDHTTSAPEAAPPSPDAPQGTTPTDAASRAAPLAQRSIAPPEAARPQKARQPTERRPSDPAPLPPHALPHGAQSRALLGAPPQAAPDAAAPHALSHATRSRALPDAPSSPSPSDTAKSHTLPDASPPHGLPDASPPHALPDAAPLHALPDPAQSHAVPDGGHSRAAPQHSPPGTSATRALPVAALPDAASQYGNGPASAPGPIPGHPVQLSVHSGPPPAVVQRPLTGEREPTRPRLGLGPPIEPGAPGHPSAASPPPPHPPERAGGRDHPPGRDHLASPDRPAVAESLGGVARDLVSGYIGYSTTQDPSLPHQAVVQRPLLANRPIDGGRSTESGAPRRGAPNGVVVLRATDGSAPPEWTPSAAPGPATRPPAADHGRATAFAPPLLRAGGARDAVAAPGSRLPGLPSGAPAVAMPSLPMPLPAPVAQRSVGSGAAAVQLLPTSEPAPVQEQTPAPATTSQSEPPAAADPPPEPEELVKALYDPLLRRLRAELRRDRERGAMTDLPLPPA